jgi:hypothetical protein
VRDFFLIHREEYWFANNEMEKKIEIPFNFYRGWIIGDHESPITKGQW